MSATLNVPGQSALSLKEHVSFSKAVGAGSLITFHSKTVDPLPDKKIRIDNTHVDLLSAEGHWLLHIGVRRAENELVFNAGKASDPWGKEERVPLRGFFQQTETTISVRIQASAYVVLIDDKVAYTFAKRIDSDVMSVHYNCNSTSVFADPITVSVMTPGAPKPQPGVPASSYQEATLNVPGQSALYLNKPISLSEAVGVGSFVTFHSKTIDPFPDKKTWIDNTNVNLLSAENDHLLRMSVRRAENQLCFNACKDSSPLTWGKEERVPLYGVFQQTETTISVRIDKSAYVVLIDGKVIHAFDKRIDKDVKGFTYNCNNTSVFANPINVSVTTPGAPKPQPSVPASSYQEKYFPLTAAGVAADSEAQPFDYVIIGSGIGGGILAADLHDKNKRMMTSHSDFGANSTSNEASMWNRSMQIAVGKDDRTKRILVIERGNLLFNTHSLNMPRPTSRGGKGQMNDVFFNDFKHAWDMDQATRDIWEGGAVYCLGGRSAVWGLFCPRISDNTLRTKFHPSVYRDLNASYLRRAEEHMNVTYPKTLPLHRELMDRLNIRTQHSLPTTQWMWGRIASEFTDQKNRNFDFAEGAFSSIDRLVEAAMDDKGNGQFKTLLDSSVMRLEPKPESGKQKPVTHVVVKDASGTEHKIRTKNAVVCAGTVDSAAILLRSMGDGVTPSQAYGEAFAANFGQATDHYIFAVSLPFYYRNMEYKDILGGMKLMTDITFQHIDHTTALANISLDASSFLPRRNVPDSELPLFILAYILPTELRRSNKVSLNAKAEPYLSIGFPEDDYIDDRKQVMLDFAVDVMNKFADTLDLQFVQNREAPTDDYVPLARVTKDNIVLKRVGPGAVAHELGSIPMASKTRDGLLDENLKMRHGWDNVHVCDLSVFPYSPAANPTLSLAALALRLSDKLVPPAETRYQPIVVYNMTPETVFVHMTNSNTDLQSLNPPDSDAAGAKIETGKSATWMREQKESIFVFASEGADNFDVQIVKPGLNTLIVSPPPKGSAAPSQRLTIRRGVA